MKIFYPFSKITPVTSTPSRYQFMSGRLSEAAEQVREEGAEDSGRGCWVMVSLGVLEAEVTTLVAEIVAYRRRGQIVFIARG